MVVQIILCDQGGVVNLEEPAFIFFRDGGLVGNNFGWCWITPHDAGQGLVANRLSSPRVTFEVHMVLEELVPGTDFCGSFLRARSYWSQMREIMPRLFSFNVLILRY